MLAMGDEKFYSASEDLMNPMRILAFLSLLSISAGHAQVDDGVNERTNESVNDPPITDPAINDGAINDGFVFDSPILGQSESRLFRLAAEQAVLKGLGAKRPRCLVRVRIELNPSGNALDATILDSSRSRKFDQLLIATIKKTQFPKPPEIFPKYYLILSLFPAGK